MTTELDFRLLRHFVAVAEELHFSRAADRLFVAQQSLSRDVRNLEQRVGMTLLTRNSRHVALTPSGKRLLMRARQMLSLHDETLRELRGKSAAVLVDIVGERLTPSQVLAGARPRADGVEFFARFHGGLQAAIPLLTSRRLDVTFGRWHGLSAQPLEDVDHRLIRLEPMCVLLPEQHPLANLDAVPLAELRSNEPCGRCGDHASAEWEEVIEQLLPTVDSKTTPPRPNVRGVDELAYHIQQWDMPVITLSSQPEIPNTVIRPLVDPTPLYPWSMMWRKDCNESALHALHDAVDELADAEGWLDRPENSWLPEPEATEFQ